MPLAWISLTLSRHFSLSFIAFGRSSRLHPVSSHICCMYVRAGRPAFAWPYAGVHRSRSLMSSSLLLQQCPVCLARVTCIVFVMGGKWPYSRLNIIWTWTKLKHKKMKWDLFYLPSMITQIFWLNRVFYEPHKYIAMKTMRCSLVDVNKGG